MLKRRGSSSDTRGRTPGLLILCAAALLTWTSCGGEKDPVEGYRAWVAALAAGDLQDAFERLSEASRAHLARMEAEASAGEIGQDTGSEWIAEDSPRGYRTFVLRVAGPTGEDLPPLPEDPEAVQILGVERSGKEALLRVETPLGAREVRLVLEDGEWRIDLR